MTLIGKKQGSLVIKKLHHRDTKKYSYPIYYYSCKCLKCGNEVVIASTNIRNYTDCGGHQKEKLTKKIPYGKRFLTIMQISEKSGLVHSYVRTLLGRGYTAEQIIKRTYPRKNK